MELLYANQLETLKVMQLPTKSKISYVSIPKGMQIYRGGEKRHSTRSIPAYYSAYEISNKYTKSGTYTNAYKANQELFFLVPSFELFQYLQLVGDSKKIYGEKYTLVSSLYALLYGDKRMNSNFVKNSALFLAFEKLDELTKYVSLHNPPGTIK